MASEVNSRTADGGRFLSFRCVTTGLLLTQPLLAASGTFDGRCQPEAAPNTYPRVGHRVTQHDATTAGGAPRPRNSSVPPRRPVNPVGSRPQAVPVHPWLGRRQPQAMAPKHPYRSVKVLMPRRGPIHAA